MVDHIEGVLQDLHVFLVLVLVAFEETGVELGREGEGDVEVKLVVGVSVLHAVVGSYLLFVLELLVHSGLLLEVVVVVLKVGRI
jgi:hypothetical protein